MRPKVLISWSSGKDSAWMLHRVRESGTYEIGALLTTVNEAVDRVAMHAVRLSLLEAQAHAVGVPLWTVPIPASCTNEIYEQRVGEAVRHAVAEGFTHVAFGDLFLDDVRQYREARLAGSGLTPVFPLWAQPTDALARDMIGGGLRAKITCVDPRVLHGAYAGREYDAGFLQGLPPSVDPCGERGEFHTFAYAGPMFTSPISIVNGDIVERDGFVFADLMPACSTRQNVIPR
jgi:uncharacterized protein (TIGR00290 family)